LLLAQQSDKPLYVASITSSSPIFPESAVHDGSGAGRRSFQMGMRTAPEAQTGCMVPGTAHSSEQLMMVSERAKAEMKDAGP